MGLIEVYFHLSLRSWIRQHSLALGQSIRAIPFSLEIPLVPIWSEDRQSNVSQLTPFAQEESVVAILSSVCEIGCWTSSVMTSHKGEESKSVDSR